VTLKQYETYYYNFLVKRHKALAHGIRLEQYNDAFIDWDLTQKELIRKGICVKRIGVAENKQHRKFRRSVHKQSFL